MLSSPGISRHLAPFPSRAAALVGVVEILHMLAANGLKHLADAVLELPGSEQVDMVDHPDVGVYLQALFAGSVHKGVAEELVIRIGGEDDLPMVAALDDMPGLAWHDVAGKAGHDMAREDNTWSVWRNIVSDTIYFSY